MTMTVSGLHFGARVKLEENTIADVAGWRTLQEAKHHAERLRESLKHYPDDEVSVRITAEPKRFRDDEDVVYNTSVLQATIEVANKSGETHRTNLAQKYWLFAGLNKESLKKFFGGLSKETEEFASFHGFTRPLQPKNRLLRLFGR